MAVEEPSVSLSGLPCPQCWARADGMRDRRMVVCGSSSPSIGSSLPLYSKVGRVHDGLGELSLWST
jgi:hypothetical protein